MANNKVLSMLLAIPLLILALGLFLAMLGIGRYSTVYCRAVVVMLCLCITIVELAVRLASFGCGTI